MLGQKKLIICFSGTASFSYAAFVILFSELKKYDQIHRITRFIKVANRIVGCFNLIDTHARTHACTHAHTHTHTHTHTYIYKHMLIHKHMVKRLIVIKHAASHLGRKKNPHSDLKQ